MIALLADALKGYRGRIYIVGGAVRDEIMGRETFDTDICVEGSSFDAAATLYNKGICPKPVYYPGCLVASVLIGGKRVDIASCRRDEYSPKSRTPIKVEPAPLSEDVLRRDFTVNALYKDLFTGEIIDFVGGRDDIDAKIIRTVIDPEVSFDRDPLRMVRCLRFAATLGFDTDPATFAALKRCRDRLKIVPKNKINEETIRFAHTPEGKALIAGSGLPL
ncbi:MAG: CCA tRNA nucleotidyltransferase [Abditibacteriota bacterium]|nr:CCA tRNA nucleotidyltransferase [Abditibacteriota bacterium]